MALFKFRKGGDEQAAPLPQPESVEAMRKRARHRLMGAALLVLAGVIGFPLLFDTQPRPIAVDIPIDIPDKSKTRPLAIAAPSAPVPVATQTVPAVPAKVAEELPVSTPKPPPKEADAAPRPLAPKEAMIADKKEDKKEEKKGDKTASASVQPSLSAIKKETSSNSKEVAESTDGAKAKALLDGSPPEKASSGNVGRFVVQVGAFADAARAKEARTKLERAGLKTYTTVVETKEGQRTRVRVGPFGDKTDADSAASKIKALDLPAAILVL